MNTEFQTVYKEQVFDVLWIPLIF